MATRLFCDRCGGEPAETVVLDVGDGPRELEMCTGCQEAMHLPELVALVDEYGVAGAQAEARAASDTPWPCPRCDVVVTTRSSLMNHLQTLTHGLTEVEASHMVPPRGAARECEMCGVLCQEGQGYAQHTQRRHKAELAAAAAEKNKPADKPAKAPAKATGKATTKRPTKTAAQKTLAGVG